MAHVLYFEDESVQVRGTVVRLETELGYTVTRTTSLADMRNYLRDKKYDAVILDISPDPIKPIVLDQSGVSLITFIRENSIRSALDGIPMPIAIATGVEDSETTWHDGSRIKVRDALNRMGIAQKCRVRKPFKAEELHAAVQAAIEQSRSASKGTEGGAS